jgi:hypothetical protein
LKAWYEKPKARPGVAAGLQVPQRAVHDSSTDPKEQERIAKENSAWIMKGVEADRK